MNYCVHISWHPLEIKKDRGEAFAVILWPPLICTNAVPDAVRKGLEMMTVLLRNLALFVMGSQIPKRICLLPLHIRYAKTRSLVFWYLRRKLQSLLLLKTKNPFFSRLLLQLSLLRMRYQRIQVLVRLLLPLINSNKFGSMG